MKWLLLFGVVFSVSVAGFAEECACSCTESCACAPSCTCEHPPRAPAGIMGDHVHHKGGWMASYRYMTAHMEGIGGGDVSGYMMRPTQMDMQMHMVGFMYAPHDRFTVAMMVPFVIKDMDMVMGAMSVPLSEHTEGIGDIRLTGIYDLWSTEVHQLLFNLSLGLPSGSIDEENSAGTRLAYPMQLGSGSYSLAPGLTYTAYDSGWGWGAQAKVDVPLHKNKHDYRLGNRYDLQAWLLRDLCPVSAISFRLDAWHRDNIDGADASLNPAMTPGADPDLKAATRVDALVGIDFRKGNARLTLEGGLPVYQHLDGPQLEAEWMVLCGVQLSF